MGEGVTACLLHNEPTSYPRLASSTTVTVGRRSESESEQGGELGGVDAKPGDLPMGRVKRR